MLDRFSVLTFSDGWVLMADNHGGPYLYPSRELCNKSASFLCVRELYSHEKERNREIAEWLSDPSNDCLRARGSLLWKAACEAEMRTR